MIIVRFGLRPNSQNSVKYLAYLSVNFTGVKKFEIWPRFLTAITFETLKEQHVGNLKQAPARR